MEEGTVIFYSEMRGFGFIAPRNDGSDVYVNSEALEKSGIKSLKSGDKVCYNLYQMKDVICAIDLKLEKCTA